ncbi:uncharacterized protein LOC121368035 [Gigantopelta aegis]|uniref:uncharacterized protein LOC121368035 n=1 Tax=Gigantopelta aegis TaxID=1735272 RepID=UPI001B88BAFC|nr:uncharacterized protein LOC121368035 [Gigantopelta aegis]
MWTLTPRCLPPSLNHVVLRCWLILCVTAVVHVVCDCPQDVTLQAYGCFTSYSTELQNMYKSRHKLCCGVNVEVLRAFCSSYVSAVACITSLKSRCPRERHSQINKSLVNLQGSEKELAELCFDDNLYEQYAIHQTCFANEGFLTEHCFERFFNSTLRIMSRVRHGSMYDLCSNMRKIMDCVKPNILMKCGPVAEGLVDKLIKPMVRRSSECDYESLDDYPPTQRLSFPRQSTPKPTLPVYSVKRHRLVITDKTALYHGRSSCATSYNFSILCVLVYVTKLLNSAS